jgi:hypothetical protein
LKSLKSLKSSKSLNRASGQTPVENRGHRTPNHRRILGFGEGRADPCREPRAPDPKSSKDFGIRRGQSRPLSRTESPGPQILEGSWSPLGTEPTPDENRGPRTPNHRRILGFGDGRADSCRGSRAPDPKSSKDFGIRRGQSRPLSRIEGPGCHFLEGFPGLTGIERAPIETSVNQC